MKLHLNGNEFNSYIRELVNEAFAEKSPIIDASDEESIAVDCAQSQLAETRAYVRGLVERTLNNLPANLRESFFESMYEKDDSEDESDPDEYFSGKDVHGNKVEKSERAYSEDAIAMLQDPIIDRDALADEIKGLSDLAEGSARSYLSKVAAGERPLPDDMAKAIVERINSIGKSKR